MSVEHLAAKRGRLKMASKIVELSDQRLSSQETGKYTALKIGSGPYSNVFAVRDKRVSCFIPSTDLVERLKAQGFKLEEAPQVTPMNRHKFYFRGLGLDDIQSHESLFREVVQESIRTVLDRRPRKK